jgi:hypothetical protein
LKKADSLEVPKKKLHRILSDPNMTQRKNLNKTEDFESKEFKDIQLEINESNLDDVKSTRTFDSFGTIASLKKVVAAEVSSKMGLMTILSNPGGSISKIMSGKVDKICGKKIVRACIVVAAAFVGQLYWVPSTRKILRDYARSLFFTATIVALKACAALLWFKHNSNKKKAIEAKAKK